METFIIVVIIFGLLVSIHELGHLLVAKRAGILCREYAIGFGPKLFAIKKGETVYTLRLLPIGGYVRMAGEDPETIELKAGQSIGLFFNKQGKVTRMVTDHLEKYPDARFITVQNSDLERELTISGYEEDDGPLIRYRLDRKATYTTDGQDFQIAPLDRQFASKSVLARFLTIFAGPFMNLLLAVVIFIIFYSIQGVPSDAPRLGQTIDGHPAQEAGLRENDRILQIDQQKINDWNDITKYIDAHPNEKMTFTVDRAGDVHHFDLVSGARETGDGGTEGFIGVYGPTDHSFVEAFKSGFTQTYTWIKLELQALSMLITGDFTLDMLGGPVRMYDLTGQVVAQGLILVLNWTAFLSVNLAVINLLPLPALDGGRLMFLIVEALRGKPVDPNKEALVHFIGFAFLMLLMILVTWNDIQGLFLR